MGLSAVEKKTKLLSAVGNQIDAHPAMFQNLLQALRKQTPLKEVVDDLEGIYKDYGRWGLVSASRRDWGEEHCSLNILYVHLWVVVIILPLLLEYQHLEDAIQCKLAYHVPSLQHLGILNSTMRESQQRHLFSFTDYSTKHFFTILWQREIVTTVFGLKNIRRLPWLQCLHFIYTVSLNLSLSTSGQEFCFFTD